MNEYLDAFVQCLAYHEKEAFPKLLDIRFLAEYVTVPFERKAEVAVRGKSPVSIFKKMVILKWGGLEEKYQEYKKGLSTFIREDFEDAEYAHEAPIYQEGFEKLVHHLEKEPNPFLV